LQKQHTDFYEPLAKRKSIKEARTVSLSCLYRN